MMDRIDEIDEMMYQAVKRKKTVHVVDVDGFVYDGMPLYYSSGANEDDGYAVFSIEDDGQFFVLGSNEIETIEIIE